MIGEYDGVVDELESGQQYWLKKPFGRACQLMLQGLSAGELPMGFDGGNLSYWVCGAVSLKLEVSETRG